MKKRKIAVGGLLAAGVLTVTPYAAYANQQPQDVQDVCEPVQHALDAVAAAQQQVAAFEQQLTVDNARLAAANDKLQAARAALDAVLQDLKASNPAVDAAERAVKAAESAVQDAQTAVNQASTGKAEADAVLTEAQRELAAAQGVVTDAQQRVAELEAAAVADDPQAALAEVNKKEQEAVAAREQLAEKRAALVAAEKSVADAQQLVDEAQKEETAARDALLALTSADTSVAAAAAELEAAKQDLAAKQQAQQDITNRIQDLKAQQVQQDQVVADARQDLVAAEDLAANADAKIAEGSFGYFSSNGSTKALDILQNSPESILQWTRKGDPRDATSLDNMMAALSLLDRFNNLRRAHGLSEMKISDTAMALAQRNANDATQEIAHDANWSTGAPADTYGGENLAWGYKDPYDGWYDKEKPFYEADPNDPRAGHYRNIINPDFSVSGIALAKYTSATQNLVPTIEQFYLSDHEGAKPHAEYLADFKKYYDNLKNAGRNAEQARAALAEAETGAYCCTGCYAAGAAANYAGATSFTIRQ